jgi:primosomal protein N' (replication factor Y)
VVIGPRSALFAPLHELGLIVIDEEHDTSYKQDATPRYFTHSVASFIAKQKNALLVFGSATPALSSYYFYQKHPQQLLEMNDRTNAKSLPEVSIINTQNEPPSEAGITPSLELAIQEHLNKKEKVMILLNRRGYSPYILCQACKKPLLCPHCQLSLTYHQDKTFRCHRCEYMTPMTHTCPSCKKNRLGFLGTGIQKVESELIKRFSGAHILRLDRDTATTPKKMEAILNNFKESGDILIGTQLIAKGHDIESVTLVGVLGIDATLGLPDYTAPEKAFQLITQVAGRAGRGQKSGRVIVQTYQPDHYAIVHASRHDFKAFYEEELSYRKALFYPPFSQIFHFIFSGKQALLVKKEAQRFYQKIRPLLDESVQCTGAMPAPIEKINNHYRWSIVMKIPLERAQALKITLKPLCVPSSSIVKIIADFEPKSIL